MQSGQFLQSDEWEKFQQDVGRKTFRVDGVLLIKMPFFKICYLFCPKCPKKITEKFLSASHKIAKKERAIFLRFEPFDMPDEKFIKTRDSNPRCTQILDISKSEEELLSKMKQKTRYNIRLAEKHKVQVKKIKAKDFEAFYGLLKETGERQSIKLFSKTRYKKMAKFNEIFIAYYKDEPIAGAIINFYKDMATYLHGGSSKKHRNVQAPSLLHWHIIKEAKGCGIKYYDWWGTDDKKFPGVTRFKQGFGGREVCAPGTFDAPFNKLIYKSYKYIKRRGGT